MCSALWSLLISIWLYFNSLGIYCQVRLLPCNSAILQRDMSTIKPSERLIPNVQRVCQLFFSPIYRAFKRYNFALFSCLVFYSHSTASEVSPSISAAYSSATTASSPLPITGTTSYISSSSSSSSSSISLCIALYASINAVLTP